MEAKTTRRRSTVRPLTKIWNEAKKLDNGEKLELIVMLTESVKPAVAEPIFDIPEEDEFDDMDKELYTPEEAYELTMKDIKAIYEDAAV